MGQVEVHWEGEYGRPHDFTASLVNLSNGGAAVRMTCPLAIGKLVSVGFTDSAVKGTVRRCELVSECQWELAIQFFAGEGRQALEYRLTKILFPGLNVSTV